MSFSYTEFLQWVGLYFYPFVRIGAMLSLIPLYGNRAVTTRTKVILALFITIAAVPSIAVPPPVDPFTWKGVLFILQQVLIGLAMGVIFLVIFQAFVVAGHLIAMGMGLAFAQMTDPTSGVSTPVVSQYFVIIVTLLFLALNGHILVLHVVVDSFEYLPIGVEFLNQQSLRLIFEFGSYMFSAGVLIALPAITALLLVNVAFGVVTRAAPALNIFAVGFPVTLLAGLVMLTLTTPVILPHLQELVHRAIETLTHLQLTSP
ncbi:flagellar biosynthetic protein FliR [Thiomicrorhabdus xiamenensis]|uniref:Flagellar biosynthetic protein FliR n=1 Tax=Thiomicrorhabdus xiamenensis TaxID=2739063 RepID=A0A7D4NRV8_9GAMM|nr:flagellar biosynthetic protein FliR [Thiomicrorhabdus xiamenensis]QKI89537.1 flagellar biosynthetic protein FliR [Thiomicrorhabdus xiamenensis]